ncbi:MAG TPA: hypothetical protein VFS40_14620 [Gemmatimonadales bacterium]|nr:hypothetical protein [Gemmatimonadales bacterium]
MRHASFFALLLAAAAAAACSDDTRSPATPTGPGPTAGPGPVPALAMLTQQEQTIQTDINVLFPTGDLLKSANSYWANIQTKVRQGRYADAQARATDLYNFALTQLKAGKLLDPNGANPPTTAGGVAKLQCDLTNYVQDPRTSPTALDCSATGAFVTTSGDALASGGVTAVVGPAGATVTTPDKHQGILIPQGAVSQLVMISVDPIPVNSSQPPLSGPLATPLDQYPLFAFFAVSPAGLAGNGNDFSKLATVGLCHLSPGDGPYAPADAAVDARLRIAHNVTTGSGETQTTTIEILTQTSAGFLSCADLTQSTLPTTSGTVGSRDAGAAPFLALTRTGLLRMGRALRPVLTALLPAELGATSSMFGTCCLGGLTTKLSPFGAVDTLGQNSANSPTSQSAGATTPVASPPSVKVVTPSGRAMAGIEVDFQVTAGGGTLNGTGSSATAYTDGNGVASLTSWTLGPTAGATNTVTATAVYVAHSGFLGNPVTFTATATAAPTQLVFDWQPTSTQNVNSAIAPPVKVQVRDAQGNLVTTAVNPITISINDDPSGGAAHLTSSGGLTVNAVNGVATFQNLKIDQPGENYTLRATSPGLTAGVSVPFTEVVGP